MNGEFTLFRGKNQQFYFSLKAPNGETIGHSEGYTRKESALNGISSVRANSQYNDRYTFLQGRDNQYYFNLKSYPNQEIILQSEGYVTKQGAENGKNAVKRYAPGALVKEQT